LLAVETSESQDRTRLAFAVIAALVLGAIVVAVVVLGGGEDGAEGVTAAAPACIRAWNGDPRATAYGRHNFNFHRYDGALVTFLTPEAEVVEAGEGGKCAVIFPSRVLDPEPIAAGQVLEHRLWTPISTLQGIQLARVAELQVDAARAPNTLLDTTGKLTPR
jgi:hypothetical protein